MNVLMKFAILSLGVVMALSTEVAEDLFSGGHVVFGSKLAPAPADVAPAYKALEEWLVAQSKDQAADGVKWRLDSAFSKAMPDGIVRSFLVYDGAAATRWKTYLPLKPWTVEKYVNKEATNLRFEVSFREKGKGIQSIFVDVVKEEDEFKVYSACSAYG